MLFSMGILNLRFTESNSNDGGDPGFLVSLPLQRPLPYSFPAFSRTNGVPRSISLAIVFKKLAAWGSN